MVNKNRIDKLERALNINDQGPLITEVIVHHSNGEQEIMTPEQAKKLEVWADPDNPGIYYDTPNSSPDRKTYTDQDLEPIRSDPRDVLLVVKREPMKI